MASLSAVKQPCSLISFQTSLSISIGVTVVSPVKPPKHHGRLAVQAIHRFQDRVGIARNIDDHVAHLAVGFLADDFHDVFFFDIDRACGAEFLGQFQPRFVASDAGDKNLRGTGMACEANVQESPC